MKARLLYGLFCLCLALFQGCGSGASDGAGDGGISGTGGPTVKGTAEKGPFLKRSTVTYKYIDIDGSEISGDSSTETDDDLGNFVLNLPTEGLINIRVQGYHFNEVIGEISDGPLTLTGLFLASDGENQLAKVNVLTHLIRDRALALMQLGAAPSLAILQAEQELLQALDDTIPKISISDFSQLSIYNNGTGSDEGNAYLLLLSAALNQYANDAATENSTQTGQLTETLNNLADDFIDGNLDSSTELLGDLTLAIQQLDPQGVIENLESRSDQVLGETLEVPDFSEYIGQFLITNPADDSTLAAPVTVLAEVPSGLRSITLALKVAGQTVDQITEQPYEFVWNPYFWSGSSNDRVTLLLAASNSLGAEIVSNIVNVTISDEVSNQLVLLAPTDGQQFENISSTSLSWESVASAASYQLQVSRTSSFTTNEVDVVQSAISFNLDGLSVGDYYWRIRARDAAERTGSWSTVSSFEVVAPSAPSLSSPSMDASIQETNTPLLAWGALEGAQSYRVQVAADESFSSPLVDQQTTTTSYQLSALEGGTYYWRLQSTNEAGHIGGFGESQSFTIAGPNAPTITSTDWEPSGEQYLTSVTWEAVEFANSYELQIARDEDFVDILVSVLSDENDSSSLTDAGTYFARVRSLNSVGLEGRWSEVIQFDSGKFSSTFGGSGFDNAKKVIPSINGGTLVLAETNSPEIDAEVDTQGDDWVLKLTRKGEVDWQFIYPVVGQESLFENIFELSSGQIILTRSLSRSDVGSVMIDESGDLVWETSTSFQSIFEFGGMTLGQLNDSDQQCDGVTSIFYQINEQDGTLSNPICLDRIGQTDYSFIEQVLVTSSGELMVSGYGEPASAPFPLTGGAYIRLFDQSFNETYFWSDFETNRQLNVQNLVELETGQIMITGQGILAAEFFASLVDIETGSATYYADNDLVDNVSLISLSEEGTHGFFGAGYIRMWDDTLRVTNERRLENAPSESTACGHYSLSADLKVFCLNLNEFGAGDIQISVSNL